MTTKTRFVVHYANSRRVARFSDYADAHRFACFISLAHGGSEIVSSAGLVGQYRHGSTTPEFAAHAAEAAQ
jgi:hypothetical protein